MLLTLRTPALRVHPLAIERLGWLRARGVRLVLAGLALYVLLRPVLGLGHQLSIWLMALLLHAAVGTGLWQPLIGALGLDPVYTGAAVRAAGGVDISGLAIAGPLGGWLHAVAPWAVLGPDRVAPDAGVSVVALGGAPVLGRGLAGLGADVLWLTLGLWLARRWGSRQVSIALIGWLIQGQIVVNHLLDAQVSIADLEASGLPFALAVAAPSNGGWFTQNLQQAPDLVRATLIGGVLVILAYACALLLLLLGHHLMRLFRRFARSTHTPPSPPAPSLREREGDQAQRRSGRGSWVAGPSRRVGLLAAICLAIATAVSPIGALAFGAPNWTGATAAPLSGGHSLVPGAAGRLRDLLHAPAASGPTTVQIQHNPDGTWQYLVNGQPQVIRGVGYNPQYASLSPAERAQLYQRDFGAMHQLGINTVEGWFEPQFDQLTLDYAARNGIGVLMPFELNQDWPYDNPNVQQSILDHVSAYVERYKDHPAVRMWAPGNEDLHRILYPHMRDQGNDPAVRKQADAFAAFLPKLVDRIHELDPNHPVIYRDAEDIYLPRLKAAFEATGVDRPWFVYGANVYTQPRLQQVIQAWPSQFLDVPLVISEYAPGGEGPAERPVGFQQDWAIIRSRPGVVLGGLAYTWATNGPEELDRVFGLVDAQGVPTDGALAALSASYLNDLAQTTGP